MKLIAILFCVFIYSSQCQMSQFNLDNIGELQDKITVTGQQAEEAIKSGTLNFGSNYPEFPGTRKLSKIETERFLETGSFSGEQHKIQTEAEIREMIANEAEGKSNIQALSSSETQATSGHKIQTLAEIQNLMKESDRNNAQIQSQAQSKAKTDSSAQAQLAAQAMNLVKQKKASKTTQLNDQVQNLLKNKNQKKKEEQKPVPQIYNKVNGVISLINQGTIHFPQGDLGLSELEAIVELHNDLISKCGSDLSKCLSSEGKESLKDDIKLIQ